MTADELDNHEAAAFHKAFDLFMRELENRVGVDGLARLARSSHVHTAFVSAGKKSMVCVVRIDFSDDEKMMLAAMETYQGPMGTA
jgi:hypothetical protein